MALRLQERRIERALLGGSGLLKAVAGWTILVLLVIAAGLLGGPILLLSVLILLGVAIVLARAGTPSHWTHWLVIISLATAFGSLAYVFWAVGANVDADDGFTAPPTAAGYAGVGILLFLGSILVLIAAAVAAAARASRARDARVQESDLGG